ncbi:hypothetical protein WFZ85_10600 [Flavobacterium sp. j3]|uniref:Lipoprotein n=1 Tax=Flavobacterium aureirubrum TaxID=3133147 RepID=A0ABU9N6K2_9FLAO
MKGNIIIIISFIILGCKSAEEQRLQDVSMIEVIANPKRFHKKHIQVQGYFTNETKGTAIYFSKSDFQNMIYKNAIFIYISNEDMKRYNLPPSQGYVTLIGIYNKDKKGTYNFYSGGFDKILNIERMYKKDGVNDEYNPE